MGKSKSDYCVYIGLSALFTGAVAQFVIPILFPSVDPLWATIFAAIIGMLLATVLLFIQDNSHQKKYRGQA